MSDVKKLSRRQFVVAVGALGASASSGGMSWYPAESARPLNASIKVDLAAIEPGQMLVETWRGRPVYMLHRTAKILALLTEEEHLLDPLSAKSKQPDFAQNRFRAPKGKELYLIVFGVCTHLGCAPQFVLNELEGRSGFFCPCHGSMYDLSGRVYKGSKAPANLEVPPYRYLDEYIVEIG